MKKFLVLLVAMSFLTGCANDRLLVINNSQRVSDLEQRMTLNEQLDALQDQRLAALEAALKAETEMREADVAALNNLIEQEETARRNGDLALALALSVQAGAQAIVNRQVERELSRIRGLIGSLNTEMTQVRADILSLSSSLSSLTTRVSALEQRVDALPSTFITQTDLTTLQTSILTQVNALIDANGAGVRIVKPCPNAAEVLLLINGVHYGVMNNFANPGNTNSNLRSVALEPLAPGTYQTTSASGNCTFTL
jgi:outer membrane murein-binding lipoprotein Lpp